MKRQAWSWIAFGLLAAPALQALDWRSEGPDLAVVRDLAVDPTRPDTLYAATSNGGLWRSSDRGAHWTLLSDDTTGSDWRWIEPDRKDTNTLWAGEDNAGQPSLWRSKDAGKTWEAVRGPVTGGERGLMHATGVRIAFAPGKPEVIVVPSTNLHYRTVDGGKSWIGFRLPNQDGYCAVIDPADPNRIYMGGRGSDQHFAISSDGGKTWTQAGAGLPAASVYQLQIHPAAPDTIYALQGFGDLWVSRDRGAHFEELGRHGDIKATDDMQMTLDPEQASVLWLSGEAGIFRGDLDAGVWQRRDEGAGPWQPGDVAIDPRDGKVVYAGMRGDGVYRSDDGGDTWTRHSSGLRAGWAERLYAAPGNATVFAQMSVGLHRRDGEGQWTAVRAPFGRDADTEPDGILFDRTAPGTIYGHYARDLWRSDDGGRSWKTALAKQKEPSLREMMKGVVSYPRPDFQSLAQDAGNGKVFYAGGGNDDPGEAVFKSVDGGANWKPAGQGIDAEDIDFILSPKAGSVLALSREHKLFRSEDGAASWAPAGNGLPNTEITAMVADPGSGDRIFVASESGLFRSEDGGAHFVRVKNGLKDDGIDSVLVAADGRVFAGAFHGVFVSSDHGNTFTALDPNAPISNVRALAIGGEPARLYVGTAVASVWSTALP